MRVEIVRYRAQARALPEHLPRIILERGRDWSDGGYFTLFDVHYEPGGGGAPQLLGSTKVLRRGQLMTQIDEKDLSCLPPDCCSLGQTIDFYAAIERLGASVEQDILSALRDVTVDEDAARAFEDEPGFLKSVLRFPEAARIFRYRPLRLHREAPAPAPMAFTYQAQLEGFDEPHVLELSFDLESRRLGRLIALAGENGTGKTRLLARLAWALSGMKHGEVLPARPPVGRVIAVSYSVLDVFNWPPSLLPGLYRPDLHRPVFDNYSYCGLRDIDGRIDPERFFSRLGDDVEEIRRWGRWDLWRGMLNDLRFIEKEPDLGRALEKGDDAFISVARRLGAGQKLAIGVMSRLLATMRNGSFVLIDEPELNLHPALLAGVLRTLNAWLEEFDAHGLLSTHSPLVLQEIPGRNVRVLNVLDRRPIVRRYEAESFGQSLSEIVAEAFELSERDKNYVSILRELVSAGMSEDDVTKLLGRSLSPNAAMALSYLVRQRKGS
ncbi:MAG TPA: AAA family ATPase [Candidatus Nanopelagicales bacterium]|nr:AAA family ATPase [Candidatus Nanopelagicales bacterium]